MLDTESLNGKETSISEHNSIQEVKRNSISKESNDGLARQWTDEELARLLELDRIPQFDGDTSNSSDNKSEESVTETAVETEASPNKNSRSPRQQKTIRTWADNGTGATVLVAFIVAGVFGVGGVAFKAMTGGTSTDSHKLSQIEQETSIPEDKTSTDTENGWLKTKLSFGTQGEQIKALAKQPLESEPQPVLEKPLPPPPPVSPPVPEPIFQQNAPTPTPMVSAPILPPPAPESVPKPELKEQMDKWANLKGLGSYEYQLPKKDKEDTQPTATSTVDTASNSESQPPYPIAVSADMPMALSDPTATQPVVAASSAPIPENKANSTENLDLLAIDEQNLLNDTPNRLLRVGQRVEGKLVTPIVWAGSALANDAFIVEIKKDMPDSNGKPFLKVGDQVVLKLREVLDNGLVVSDSIELIRDGIEYKLPKDAISLRGESGNPLMAEKRGNGTGAIALLDMQGLLFSAMGKMGEILNRPESTSSTIISGNGGFANTSNSQNGKPDLLGAVLEGGFKPLADNLQRRNEKEIEDILKKEKLWVVEQGTLVQVFINNSFELPAIK